MSKLTTEHTDPSASGSSAPGSSASLRRIQRVKRQQAARTARESRRTERRARQHPGYERAAWEPARNASPSQPHAQYARNTAADQSERPADNGPPRTTRLLKTAQHAATHVSANISLSHDLSPVAQGVALLASNLLTWMRPAPMLNIPVDAPIFGFIHRDVFTQFQEAPILGITQLLAHHAGTNADDKRYSEHPPLILIHGLAGTSGNFAPMRVWLSRHRPRPVHVFDYRAYGDMFPAAEAFGDWLDEVASLYDEDVPFEILAHSMGGLITRLALRDTQRAKRISHVVTLGTPHQGTRLARLGASTFLRQLRVDSDVFQALEAAETSPLPYPLTSIWTERDILVLPAFNATLPGYPAYAMHQSTHLSWLLHPHMIDEVFSILDAKRMTYGRVTLA